MGYFLISIAIFALFILVRNNIVCQERLRIFDEIYLDELHNGTFNFLQRVDLLPSYNYMLFCQPLKWHWDTPGRISHAREGQQMTEIVVTNVPAGTAPFIPPQIIDAHLQLADDGCPIHEDEAAPTERD